MSQDLPDLTADDVKAFRFSLKLSQVAFAERLGIGRRTVEDWEKKGAPGYWRMNFAAVNAGLEPWKSDLPVEPKPKGRTQRWI